MPVTVTWSVQCANVPADPMPNSRPVLSSTRNPVDLTVDDIDLRRPLRGRSARGATRLPMSPLLANAPHERDAAASQAGAQGKDPPRRPTGAGQIVPVVVAVVIF